MYHEARGETLAGQLAVAQVVINRKNSDIWADTYCKVVAEPDQFSWYPGSGQSWKEFRLIAAKVVLFESLGWTVSPAAADSLFFASVRFRDKRLTQDIKIGKHRFYSFKDSYDI